MMSAKKSSNDGVKHHIGIEIELLLGTNQQQNGSAASSATSPRDVMARGRGGASSQHQPMQIGPSKKRTYGLWLLSDGKEMPIDKEDDQPVVAFNTTRPRWELSSVMYSHPLPLPDELSATFPFISLYVPFIYYFFFICSWRTPRGSCIFNIIFMCVLHVLRDICVCCNVTLMYLPRRGSI
jgi:hypothetical protein